MICTQSATASGARIGDRPEVASLLGFWNRPGGNRTPNPLPKGGRFSTGFGGKTRFFHGLSWDFTPEPLPKSSPISNQIATGFVAGRIVAPVGALTTTQGEGE